MLQRHIDELEYKQALQDGNIYASDAELDDAILSRRMRRAELRSFKQALKSSDCWLRQLELSRIGRL